MFHSPPHPPPPPPPPTPSPDPNRRDFWMSFSLMRAPRMIKHSMGAKTGRADLSNETEIMIGSSLLTEIKANPTPTPSTRHPFGSINIDCVCLIYGNNADALIDPSQGDAVYLSCNTKIGQNDDSILLKTRPVHPGVRAAGAPRAICGARPEPGAAAVLSGGMPSSSPPAVFSLQRWNRLWLFLLSGVRIIISE